MKLKWCQVKRADLSQIYAPASFTEYKLIAEYGWKSITTADKAQPSPAETLGRWGGGHGRKDPPGCPRGSRPGRPILASDA